MAIKAGERLPEGTLSEYFDQEAEGCTLGPNQHQVAKLAAGKRLIVFGLPGAFTPTCSAKHVPGYLAQFDQLKAKGIDEIWCISVNDPWVMGAWARDQKTSGKIRMLADGSAVYTKALGLDVDMGAKGLGIRSARYALLVDDGVVKAVNIEQPGKFEVSNAETMLNLI